MNNTFQVLAGIVVGSCLGVAGSSFYQAHHLNIEACPPAYIDERPGVLGCPHHIILPIRVNGNPWTFSFCPISPEGTWSLPDVAPWGAKIEK